jgi:hypothetical protein
MLLTQPLCRWPDLQADLLIAALDVMVAPGGRRLGDIDRIRTRNGVLQPLLQDPIQPGRLWRRSVVRS